MRSLTIRRVLRSSVAVGAVAMASGTANAQCTTANGVVTCTGATTADQANDAINNSPPPSVRLVVTRGAIVTRGFSNFITPNNPPFNGAIGYTNEGIVGLPGADVDFRYFGSLDLATNTFTFDNRGTQNGGIFAFNVGGAINGTNSGTVTRGIDLRGAGPITFANTGTVSGPPFSFFNPAIALSSSRFVSQTSADGITRTTETGGPIAAAIGGFVGIPASGATAAQPQDVVARSVGGVDVTVTGTAGRIEASSRGGATVSRNASQRIGDTETIDRIQDEISLGENARITIAADGRVNSATALSGPGTATVIVNGTVGAGATFNNSVSASANGFDRTFRQTQVFDYGSDYSITSTSTTATTSRGGAALTEISATGRVSGNATAFSNAGSATVLVAGQVGSGSSFGVASAESSGANSRSDNRFTNRADGSFEFSGSQSASLSGGAALTTVTATGVVVGGASARGDRSATVDNAGRISGATSAFSSTVLNTSSSGSSSRTIGTDAAGNRMVIDQDSNTGTSETLGGRATITNRAGAMIDGSVSIGSVGEATLDNAGTITGNIFLNSAGVRRFSTGNGRSTTTSAPAAGGGMATTQFNEQTSTDRATPVGAGVTGTYSGTVGVEQPINSIVQQTAATTSTATVTGTLFANFVGTAGAYTDERTRTVVNREVIQPNGSSSRTQTDTSRIAATPTASTSRLTVGATGRILDNRGGTGDASLESIGGDAIFTLDGGRVDGSVRLLAGSGVAGVNASETNSTFATPARSGSTVFPETLQSRTTVSSSESRAAAGSATATVNGGSIGGDLVVAGTGTGAGSLGATVLVNGTVGGRVAGSALRRDTRSTSNEVAMQTGPNAATRSVTTTSASAPAANSGGVLITVNGNVGGALEAAAGVGPATVNLNGRAGTLSADGVSVTAFDSSSQSETSRTFTGTSVFGANQTTSSRSTGSSTALGGVATLNVAASADVRAAGASSAEGDIAVQGIAGSVLNVTAGSRLVQNAGTVLVGATGFNTTLSSEGTFTNGVQTATRSTSSATAVGGPATLNNAGVIGSAANQTNVTVTSVGGATLTNSGTINGSVLAQARNANRSTTTTATDQNSVANRRSVSNNAFTAVGGAVQVTNTGLVTGGVSAIGATGAVTNSGVVRGGVILGGSFNNLSTTTTTFNRTNSNGQVVEIREDSPSVLTGPLFTQTYVLNQNGLLTGGVNVTGTTFVSPSGPAVRTSDVNATINLNNGSITLGNITADADTNTNVNLNGSGFLGVAANDRTGQAGAAFQSTPSLTRFAALDPGLGTGAALPSGSRILGVRTLTKAGDGIFVIVGAPLLAGSATAAPTYTLDVGTVRVSGGELQLGLAGTTATANSFGIRGNVENNANLVIGRRITDGTFSAIQGINLSVLGNVTNAAAGNLIVGVNPGFIRAGAAGGDPFAGGPIVAFGPGSPGLASTNSFVRVDGNLNLAGTLVVQGQPGGLYEAGRAYDLFSVSGAYANTGTVRSDFTSPFVSFTLTPRSEGGRTLVSLDVVRASFDTVATDANAAAAAGALQSGLPSIFAGIRAGTGGANGQDLAAIVAALDTQLTAAQSAQLFRELSSGEFYGSLAAVSTTAPFGEAVDGLPTAGTDAGLGIWLRPTGQFANYDANAVTGASGIGADNYGGSIGVNYATGTGGNIGLAVGYGTLTVDATTPERAEADTHMVGVYANQQLGGLNFSAQAVYGSSDWTASRALPTLGRTAAAAFQSEEIRASARIAYRIDAVPGVAISPFAAAEASS